VIEEKQTCPRRMNEMGPWAYEENLDRWRRDRWKTSQEEADRERSEFKAKYPGSDMGNTYWEWGTQPRTCSFCGSVHPDDLVQLLRHGWRLEPSDKGYKFYVEPEVHRPSGLIPPAKFYRMHASPEQIEEIHRALMSL